MFYYGRLRFLHHHLRTNTLNLKRLKSKVCIVGSGPAGFYTAELLLKNSDTHVDIIEKLPIPFGLIRFGVAPDHPEIKNAINKFNETAKNENFGFYGNINVGQDISVKELLDSYNAVILAYGAEVDHTLGIPGEDSKNVFSARRIVGWYNGLPENAEENVDLDTEVATIVGHGNVAIDVARILLRDPKELEDTDITEHALEALKKSRIRKVVLVGRRGALQVAFTIKEFRELTKLNGCQTLINPSDVLGVKELVPTIARPRLRLTQLLLSTSEEAQNNSATRNADVKFYRNPKEIVCDTNNKPKKVILGVNNPEGSPDSGKVTSTGEEETVDCGLVVRSVRYKSTVIDPSIPFDEKLSIIPNKEGRAICKEALYCSGWLKTGPIGVIPSTMRTSYETGSKLLADLKNGDIPTKDLGGSKDILTLLNQRGILVTTFDHWKKIDAEEQRRGQTKNKPREKITNVSEMLQIAGLK